MASDSDNRGVILAAAAPALSGSGNFSRQQVYNVCHALIIGINKYPKLLQGKNLTYAVNDATSMRDILATKYGFTDIRYLPDDRASKTDIETELSRLSRPDVVGKNDCVLIYFAGHGQMVQKPRTGEVGYIVPATAEVDLSNSTVAQPYEDTCVRLDTVRQKVELIPAKHVIVILDSCFSGIYNIQRSLDSPSDPDEESVHTWADHPVTIGITAGAKQQTVREDTDLGHGVLTYYLWRELTSRSDTILTALQLFTDIQPQVMEKTRQSQQPTLGWDDPNSQGQFLFIGEGARPGAYAPQMKFLIPENGSRVDGNTAAVRVQLQSRRQIRLLSAQLFVNDTLVPTTAPMPQDVSPATPWNLDMSARLVAGLNRLSVMVTYSETGRPGVKTCKIDSEVTTSTP